jgi:hypothetical protein
MEKNRRLAPVILATIEKVLNDDGDFVTEQIVPANLGRRPAEGPVAVHFLDLD